MKNFHQFYSNKILASILYRKYNSINHLKMENAEINTEINGRERRDTLPLVYRLRATQLLSQLWSKAVDLRVNAQILRQNAPCSELFNFLYCGTA